MERGTATGAPDRWQALGAVIERVLAARAAAGIAIARVEGARELVTVVPGQLSEDVLRENQGWDLPLRTVATIQTGSGPGRAIFEELPRGVPSTSLDRSGRRPGFVDSILEQTIATHDLGRVVGALHPALVFVDPPGDRLVGVAQRPFRADAASSKPDGTAPLFDLEHLTPAEVRGELWTTADDAYQIALLIWRWRHGRGPLEGVDALRQLAVLNGRASLPAATADELDVVLGRAMSFERKDRPSLQELRQAVSEARW